MRLPGPDHPITLSASSARVVVRFGGRIIADSSRALELREAAYTPVLYLPREDVAMGLLRRTDHATHCPFKGDAAYYAIAVDGATANNAAWTYETPFPAVAAIAGHLAFYANKVDAIEVAAPAPG